MQHRKPSLFSLCAFALPLAFSACTGDQGHDGAAGTSCTTTENDDGSITIECGDGSTAKVAGTTGKDGSSCSLTTDDKGVTTIACEGDDPATVVTCQLNATKCDGDALMRCGTEGWAIDTECEVGTCNSKEGWCGPDDGTLRLADTSSVAGVDTGRLEVFHEGIWGTICDDTFDEDGNAATVACKELGYDYGAMGPNGTVAGTAVPIWLDEVTCQGDELSLVNDCLHNHWGNNDCSRSEDVFVSCTDTPPPA